MVEFECWLLICYCAIVRALRPSASLFSCPFSVILSTLNHFRGNDVQASATRVDCAGTCLGTDMDAYACARVQKI